MIESESSNRQTSGYRRRYSIWILLAIIAAVVVGKVLEPVAKMPPFRLDVMLVTTFAAVASIPFAVHVCFQRSSTSSLLKILVWAGLLMSLLISCLQL